MTEEREGHEPKKVKEIEFRINGGKMESIDPRLRKILGVPPDKEPRIPHYRGPISEALRSDLGRWVPLGFWERLEAVGLLVYYVLFKHKTKPGGPTRYEAFKIGLLDITTYEEFIPYE